MIMNEISYRWELSKLHRLRSKTVGMFKQLQEKARKEKKPREDIQSLISEEIFEVDMIDDEIEILESRYLIESARQLILPIPDFDINSDTWKESKITRRFRLSKKAMVDMRSLVRKERKERREGIMLWLASLIGIIGALSGLLAVWKS